MDHSRYNQTDPWDNGVYGTGRTEPPKNNSGIIALMMIIIIFLSGIVSGLSFMNVRLFQQLQEVKSETDSVPMAFSDKELEESIRENALQEALQEADTVEIPSLGISGNYVTAFDQHYFSWPAGMLITHLEENSSGCRIGLKTGDILIQINEFPLSSQEEVDAFLKNTGNAAALRLLVYRDGTEYILSGNQS